MADIADVELALVTLLGSAVYPNGPSSPSSITLTNGAHPDCRIFPGWPSPPNLDADVASGIINISVFAQPGLERNVTRYPREWVDQNLQPPGIAASVVGTLITLAGQPNANDYATVIIDGRYAYSVAAQQGDTAQLLCANLASQIAADFPGSSWSDDTVLVSSTAAIVARTAAPGTVIREVKRQDRRFQITVWAPDNDARVAAGRVIDPALSAQDRLLLVSDNTLGRLIYASANDLDRSTKQSIMCRDSFWWVEYPTTQTMPGYPITAFPTTINAGNGSPNGGSLTQVN